MRSLFLVSFLIPDQAIAQQRHLKFFWIEPPQQQQQQNCESKIEEFLFEI